MDGASSHGLPPELLSLVSTGLTKNSDYIRFRSACVPWRGAAAPQPRHLPPQAPLLVRFGTMNGPYRGFYSPSTDKTRWMHLPETLHKRCCGSSHGWLAFVVDGRSAEVFLMNPATGARIDLPAITSTTTQQPDHCVAAEYYRTPSADRWDGGYRLQLGTGSGSSSSTWMMRDNKYYRIQKIVISSSPHGGDAWTAMALVGLTGRIMFWRPGDANWTTVDIVNGEGEREKRRTLDIIWYDGLFYSINDAGKLAAMHVDAADPSAEVKTTSVVVHGPLAILAPTRYLVECDGELLLAVRHVRFNGPHRRSRTDYGFDVYKLDLIKGESSKAPPIVKSLGDRALFLGTNHSFSLSAADFPGCRGNCIYFTDDIPGDDVDRSIGGYGAGLFNMEEDTIQPFPCCPISSRFVWPPHVWIRPNLS